jgi:hypothetical protein
VTAPVFDVRRSHFLILPSWTTYRQYIYNATIIFPFLSLSHVDAEEGKSTLLSFFFLVVLTSHVRLSRLDIIT